MKISKEIYDLCLNRAKEVLNVRFDKDLANILGMPTTTFNTKKKAFDFPDVELYALCSKRPELNIDMDYILTGISSSSYERSIADAGINSDFPELLNDLHLSDEEKQLIRDFRRCDRVGKEAGKKVLRAMADQREYLPKTKG